MSNSLICFMMGCTGFSCALVKSREAAEEIVSDVFIKLWQIRGRLEEIDNLKINEMKDAIKFGAFVFGLPILFVFVENHFTEAYPGEQLLVVWKDVIDLVLAVLLFPLFAMWFRKLRLRRAREFFFAYFLLSLFVVNCVFFFTGEGFLSFDLIKGLVTRADNRLTFVFELINPLVAFGVAWTFFGRRRVVVA